MKEWLTAREIAAEKLPYLPDTKRGIQLLATRENWDAHPYAQPRLGRGGGMEYRYLILPVAAQVAYVQRYRMIGPNQAPAQTTTATSDLSGRGQLERDARLAVLAAFDDFYRGMQARGRTNAFALDYFSRKYNGGSLQIAGWVREAVAAISPRSLMRWKAAIKKGAKDRLAVDRSDARKGKGLLETANGGAVRAFVLAWIAKNPALSADIIRGYCEDHFGAEIVDRNGEVKALPPTRTFQHVIAALKVSERVVLTKITDPDTFRSTMKLSGTGTYRHVTEPNALWMIDASPVDALCLDGRYAMYGCIDLASRRYVITLSKTPRASAVGLMMRKAILKWGVAHVIKTDNGSDFVAIATKRLFTDLDITPDVSDAYSPEQKGHIERAIGTFQREVCPQLPGYIGHSVADRKAIEGRKSFAQRLGADDRELFEVALTAEQLQQHIDDWLDYVYHERSHGGLKDKTPNEVAAAAIAPIRRVDERALDALLMPVAGKNGHRKMTKQGIKIDGFHYINGAIMVGTEVFVRLDPLDMGKVYVFDADNGRFIDQATCAELAEVNPKEFVKAQQQLAAEVIRAREREIKADIRILKQGPSGIERTIRLAKRKAAERDATSANVIHLPKREEVHSTPQIAAALDAVTRPKAGSQPKPLNERAQLLHEAMLREAEFKHASKVVHLDPDAALAPSAKRYKWALALEKQIESGVALDDETAGNLARFQASSHYRTIRDIHKDFGLEAALTSAPR